MPFKNNTLYLIYVENWNLMYVFQLEKKLPVGWYLHCIFKYYKLKFDSDFLAYFHGLNEHVGDFSISQTNYVNFRR